MSIIKDSLTQIILTILRNAEVQDLDARKIALLSKTLLAIERFPRLIPWENSLRIYIKNEIGTNKLWRRIGFEEDNITLGDEESINGPYGHDGRWTVIFEHYHGADLDLRAEDHHIVVEWCSLACSEISSSVNNVEIDYYDEVGWSVFDSFDDSEDDDSEDDDLDEAEDDDLDDIENDEEDKQDEDDDQNEYEVANSDGPVAYNYALVEQLLRKNYGHYIDGPNIHIGGAHFTVDMVVKLALTDIINNPTLIPEGIISRWIAYFQT